jgi:hypothetical protein
LGVRRVITRAADEVSWPVGGVLLFYTDGLVERRDADLDTRLAQLARVVPADDPERVCARVMHEMIRNEAVRDDVAVLAARRVPTD